MSSAAARQRTSKVCERTTHKTQLAYFEYSTTYTSLLLWCLPVFFRCQAIDIQMGNTSVRLDKCCLDERKRFDTCEARRWKDGLITTPDVCRQQWEDYKSCIEGVMSQKVAGILAERNSTIPTTTATDTNTPNTTTSTKQ